MSNIVIGGEYRVKSVSEIMATLDSQGSCKISGLYFNPDMYSCAGEYVKINDDYVTRSECYGSSNLGMWTWSAEWLVVDSVDLTDAEACAYIYALLMKQARLL